MRRTISTTVPSVFALPGAAGALVDRPVNCLYSAFDLNPWLFTLRAGRCVGARRAAICSRDSLRGLASRGQGETATPRFSFN
jgi:hypothetical protein